MSRMFSQGFTTKKDGHGFGLHSAAIAAKELGGTLTVHSEGLGKGATFILELPLAPAGSPGLDEASAGMSAASLGPQPIEKPRVSPALDMPLVGSGSSEIAR